MFRKTVDGIVSDSEDVRRALTSADQIGKGFIVLDRQTCRCLICDEVFTRQGAAQHSFEICCPSPPISASRLTFL